MKDKWLRLIPLLILTLLAAWMLCQISARQTLPSGRQWAALLAVASGWLLYRRGEKQAATFLTVVLLLGILGGLNFWYDWKTVSYFFRGPGFEISTPSLDYKLLIVLAVHLWVNAWFFAPYYRRVGDFFKTDKSD